MRDSERKDAIARPGLEPEPCGNNERRTSESSEQLQSQRMADGYRAAVEAGWGSIWLMKAVRSASQPMADMKLDTAMAEAEAAGKKDHHGTMGLLVEPRPVAMASGQ